MRIGQLKEDIKITLDNEQVDNKSKATWAMHDTKNNGLITLTKAGEPGKSHYICGTIAAFDTTLVSILQVKDDTTIIAYAVASQACANTDLFKLKITEGNDAIFILPASGTAGVTGYLTVFGYTE